MDEKPIFLISDEQPEVNFRDCKDVEKMLVSQYSSKKNRVVYPDTLEFGQNCVEVYRLLSYEEHIFKKVQSLHEPMVDFD